MSMIGKIFRVLGICCPGMFVEVLMVNLAFLLTVFWENRVMITPCYDYFSSYFGFN